MFKEIKNFIVKYILMPIWRKISPIWSAIFWDNKIVLRLLAVLLVAVSCFTYSQYKQIESLKNTIAVINSSETYVDDLKNEVLLYFDKKIENRESIKYRDIDAITGSHDYSQEILELLVDKEYLTRDVVDLGLYEYPYPQCKSLFTLKGKSKAKHLKKINDLYK